MLMLYLAIVEAEIMVGFAAECAEDKLFEEKDIVFDVDDSDLPDTPIGSCVKDRENAWDSLRFLVLGRTGILKPKHYTMYGGYDGKITDDELMNDFQKHWKEAQETMFWKLERRLFKKSERLVVDNWPAIKRVARALLKKGRLSQSTLDALISKA
jgi:hypothetical protein